MVLHQIEVIAAPIADDFKRPSVDSFEQVAAAVLVAMLALELVAVLGLIAVACCVLRYVLKDADETQ